MTSLAMLLDDITTRAWTQLTEGTADRAGAPGALREAARLLDLLAFDQHRDGTAAERSRALSEMTSLCRLVASQSADHRPAEPGRLCELMAVTADTAATMTPALSTGERWALACALFDPLCACTGVVRELSNTPAVIDLARALDTLRRWSRQCPPTPAEQTRLDWARPTTLAWQQSASSRLLRQMDHIAYLAATSELDPSDARHVTAAALHVALYARPILARLANPGRESSAADIGQACAASWFGVRDTIRDLIPKPRPTPWAPLVAEFVTDLVRVFGRPEDRTDVRIDACSAAIATTFRSLLNRLPETADALAQAAAGWGRHTAPPGIDVRAPLAWRDHHGLEHYAGIAASRAEPLLSAAVATAVLAARRASVSACAHADASAMRLGDQPHPHLAAAFRAEVGCIEPAPESRWRSVVERIDRRVTLDTGWPVLARILDLTSGDGFDAAAQLPRIAADLPERHPSIELAYRVLGECSLEPADHAQTVIADIVRTGRVVPLAPNPPRPPARQAPGR